MSVPRTVLLACTLAAFSLASVPMAATAQVSAAPGAAQPEQPKPIYDEQADASKQIEAAVARAKKENRRVLIQWGANWCSWCRVLHNTFQTDAKIRRKLLYEYDVVYVDIGKLDKNMELAASYGANLKDAGVPYLTILDGEGKVVTNQRTDDLEVKGVKEQSHDPAKVLEFLEKHQAAYLDAEAVLSEAMTKARESDRVVFVHFGAPWCGWCHRLEDWLARNEISKILAKDFVEVKIDTDRMIGGAEMLNRYRKSESGGIPWFAFLDAKGETIVTSDGPNGNVGCPWTDEEINAFGDMLRKARRNLSDAAVDRLLATMRDAREAAK